MYPSYFLNLHGNFSNSYDIEKENNHPVFLWMTKFTGLSFKIFILILFFLSSASPPLSLLSCLLTHITQGLNPSPEQFTFLSP